MADNTHQDSQWWAKVDIKTWIAIISIFFLISGGVESIKSSVAKIEESTKELVESVKKIEENQRKIENNDMRQDYDISDLKKRVDKLENK